MSEFEQSWVESERQRHQQLLQGLKRDLRSGGLSVAVAGSSTAEVPSHRTTGSALSPRRSAAVKRQVEPRSLTDT